MNLVTLICPSCGARVRITHQTSRAQCEYCGSEHLIHRPEAAAGIGIDQLERARVPLPESVTFKRYAQGLQFTRRWISPGIFFLGFFCLFWDGFLCAWYSIAISSDSLMMLVFPLLHLAVGVGLTYTVICGIFNKTWIELNQKQLRIEHGPLPWPGNVQVPINQLDQLYVKEKVVNRKRSSTTQYELCAVLTNNRKLTLLTGLDSPDIAFFIEQQVEEWLQISDHRVGGEMAVA